MTRLPNGSSTYLRAVNTCTLTGKRHARLEHRSLVGKRTVTKLTLSSVSGPKEPPLIHSTLSSYFTNHILAHHSTRPGLICRTEPPRAHGGPPSRNLGVDTHLAWDFEEFNRHIHALARGLLDLGVKKGDRVGVVMGNNRSVEYDSWKGRGTEYRNDIVFSSSSAYAMLQWACASIGAVLVTLNPAYRLNEFVRPHA